MPELPEVITIRNDLKKEILGKKIAEVWAQDKAKEKEFSPVVIGAKIVGVDNHAKLLTLKLSSQQHIVIHLNMTGVLLFNSTDPYVRVSLKFDDSSTLNFSDTRMFGFFKLWSEQELKAYVSRYGKSALDESLDDIKFADTMKKTNTSIKNALLDQKLISGIGNIYANDALYLSGINPKRKTREIKSEEYAKLFKNLREVLLEGIKNRGSSIDRYKDIYGRQGIQQNFFRVYGKAGKKCDKCGTKIVFEKVQGRGTFYCPTCQPQNDFDKTCQSFAARCHLESTPNYEN